MARFDDWYALTRALLSGKHDDAKAFIAQIVAHERSKNASSTNAHRLERLAGEYSIGGRLMRQLPVDRNGSLDWREPRDLMAELWMPMEIHNEVDGLICEHARRDELLEYGVPPRNRLLLYGQPGTGKTSLAETIAARLKLPFGVVRLERMIDSHLGETGKNLAMVFDIAAKAGECVLFLDEMDALAASRRGRDDVGEMNRVVINVLQAMDRMPANVVLIGATNRDDVLDKAIFRRFDESWELPGPTDETRQLWLDRVSQKLFNMGVSVAVPEIAKTASYADMVRAEKKIIREAILSRSSNGVRQSGRTGVRDHAESGSAGRY